MRETQNYFRHDKVSAAPASGAFLPNISDQEHRGKSLGLNKRKMNNFFGNQRRFGPAVNSTKENPINLTMDVQMEKSDQFTAKSPGVTRSLNRNMAYMNQI